MEHLASSPREQLKQEPSPAEQGQTATLAEPKSLTPPQFSVTSSGPEEKSTETTAESSLAVENGSGRISSLAAQRPLTTRTGSQTLTPPPFKVTATKPQENKSAEVEADQEKESEKESRKKKPHGNDHPGAV